MILLIISSNSCVEDCSFRDGKLREGDRPRENEEFSEDEEAAKAIEGNEDNCIADEVCLLLRMKICRFLCDCTISISDSERSEKAGDVDMSIKLYS